MLVSFGPYVEIGSALDLASCSDAALGELGAGVEIEHFQSPRMEIATTRVWGKAWHVGGGSTMVGSEHVPWRRIFVQQDCSLQLCQVRSCLAWSSCVGKVLFCAVYGKVGCSEKGTLCMDLGQDLLHNLSSSLAVDPLPLGRSFVLTVSESHTSDTTLTRPPS